MRLPNGLVKHSRERLGRRLSKLRRTRSGRAEPKLRRARPGRAEPKLRRTRSGRAEPKLRRTRPGPAEPKLRRARPGRAAARLSRVRVGGVRARLSRGRLGRALVGYGQERLDRAVVKHGADRVARVLVLLVVLLMGGGTAAALAVLPSGLPGVAADGAPDGPAPSRFADGLLVAETEKPRRAGRSYYRKTAARRVPASIGSGFLALYREAARSFGVSWRLIASIHRQETAFSTAPTTYHGLNAFGCCAGPMQFNVTNGPPSTWALYRQSFRQGDRPRRYPHPTRHHPSIYDDFDAIMAAGALLRDSGATDLLDGGAWTAAYAYYGHDDYGVDYASEVVARAQGWEIYGFCLNCPVDGTLVAALHDAYGVDARRQLLADERSKKKKKKAKKRKKRADRDAGDEQAQHEREPSSSSADEETRPQPAAPTETTPAAPPSTTTTTPTTTTEAPPAAPPPPAPCRGLKKLLGCG